MLKRRPGGRGGPKPDKNRGLAPITPKNWPRIVCVGGGPSLTQMQCGLITEAQQHGWRVIVINNSWVRVPTADVLYACDDTWWGFYKGALAGFKGERWSPSRWAAHHHHLHHAQTYAGSGLNRDPWCTFSGSNSGHQVLNLAYHFGAKDVVLVGYDMQRTYGMSHWHGDHPPELERPMPIDTWVEGMNHIAEDLVEVDVRVVNASIETALTCFERLPLETALCL